MTVPFFSAKSLSGDEVKGFYYQVPESYRCPIGDKQEIKLQHYLVTIRPLDWDLPYQVSSIQIDPSTLKFLKEIDINKE